MSGPFGNGDEVEWDSQSNATQRTKRGIVVAVVGRRRMPTELLAWPDLARTHCLHNCEGAAGLTRGYRDHESYLVATPGGRGKTGQRIKSRLYWPRVQHLRRVAR